MQDQEMKRIITSSFQPYYCGVEFRPVNGDEGLGIQVSDKDDAIYGKGHAESAAGRLRLAHQDLARWCERERVQARSTIAS